MNDIMEMKDVEFGEDVRVGDKVKGTIVTVHPNEIFVDLKSFTEGVMFLDHYTKDKNVASFTDIFKEGDEISCEVSKVDQENGHIYLSCLNLIQEENYQKVKALFEAGETISVKVVKKVLKGFNVKYNEFTFFMHESQAPKETAVGEVLDVKITDIDERHYSGKVSRRVIDKEIMSADRENEFNSINVGDVLEGTIDKVEQFGLFVKFKYNHGLVRINQVSHTFIKDLKSQFKAGDKVTVKVVAKEDKKIALSMKALLKTPFELYQEAHKVGETVTGKCVNKLPFGLILELDNDVRGLLHNSEYSWNPNDNFSASVKIGDPVTVAITQFTAKGERISLSRKALMENPWARVKAKEGDVVECKITSFEPKGMVVSTLGVDGFISSYDALAEGTNGKVDDFFAVGDTVTGVITEIDSKTWTLKISVKRYLANQERKEFEKYMNETKEEEATTIGDIFKDVLKK